MMRKRMTYISALVALAVVGTLAWTMTVRAGYESAEYKVIETDGKIEIRQYPDLMLASTSSKIDANGNDGSFMRLFRYISGANESDKKISMTTPVFMEDTESNSSGTNPSGTMGFVMPKDVAAAGVPDPKAADVTIRKRQGGRFAVIRFSGRIDSKMAEAQESKLRKWMESKGLVGEASAETAGYDPPFTPGPLRRNEVLIRLSPSSGSQPSSAAVPAE